MKAHYRRVAKRLAEKMAELDQIRDQQDLAHLHRLVVDLKTCLPERHAYEQSPRLLDGLRVTTPEALPAYALRLQDMLATVSREYAERAKEPHTHE